MAAVASSQRAVCAALRTTAVQQHRSVAAAPAPARQAAVFAPKRSLAAKARRASTVAVQASSGGLPIDLRGKRAFIAGVADDQGFGWAIAKCLAEAGAEISLGVWVPALNIFETSFRRGKFDESRRLSNGSLMDFAHIYPMDAVFDTLEDVPQDVLENKRYAGNEGWTVSETAAKVAKDWGKVDILVHSLANGPEVQKSLLETSRRGYLAAMSASSYSFVSLMQGGAAISLTYVAADRVIPGYGGGMSSAKAALESDTKVLAFEAGRKYGVRVNTISAGPLGSRAAKAIGFIDDMIRYSYENAPVKKELAATEVGAVAAFLCSPLASAVTGQTVYVDNGLSIMGLAVDSKTLERHKRHASSVRLLSQSRRHISKMPLLYWRPCIELTVEADKGEAWRTVVVQESTTLFNLHRVIQIAFCKSKMPSDSRIEQQAFAFYLHGDKLKAPKSNSLADTVGAEFMKGKAPLKYEAGSKKYTVTAGKRAIADTQHYVPRCIEGSAEAELDVANCKFTRTRFSKMTERNRKQKAPMRVWCSSQKPQEVLEQGVLAAMRMGVTAEGKRYKRMLEYEAEEAQRKAQRAAKKAQAREA
ncbi:hypothetical protein COHA_003229 [Chlorella ohadii]|uniref:Enoyl-ACP reductase n=1 Tax=Chlorella ohadii TaxID=2649997 RepID=A0AAD5DSC5_9CHLO|nr:hypothetical protein COHA_003229 [Chlorella ohadii]